MSVLLVDKIVIDALVTAARAWGVVDYLDAHIFGRVIWAANARAAQMPEPARYTVQDLPGRPRAEQVLRLVDTVAYQCGDHIAPTIYGEVFAELRAEAVARSLDAYPPQARPPVDAEAATVRRSFGYTSARHLLYERDRDGFSWG